LSSIGLEDFLNKNWKWKKPAMISPEGEIHKNWVLFPEKINGKFAILHSISPKILVDYFDDPADFDEEEVVIKSKYNRVSNTGAWDSWIRDRHRLKRRMAGCCSITPWISAIPTVISLAP
jgi:predicted GH43/DUF377 family glycosyl hydrolase